MIYLFQFSKSEIARMAVEEVDMIPFLTDAKTTENIDVFAVSALLAFWIALGSGSSSANTLSANVADYNAALVAATNGVLTVPAGWRPIT